MDFDSEQERLLEDVIKLAASRKRAFKPVTVLIDGPVSYTHLTLPTNREV
mgnify:CR=1 FL=1